jgi:hypothetical protein
MAAVTTHTNGGDVAAMEMMAFLAELGARPRGAAFRSRRREDSSVSNVQIIEWQGEGVTTRNHGTIRRDIRPTEDDSDDSAKLFRDRIENRLRVLSKPRGARRIKRGRRAGQIKGRQEIVDSAAASALRAGARLVKDRMEERVNLQKDNSGGSLRPPTSTSYANWREDEYGVPPSESLEASGQLLNNLASGSITIIKGQTLLDRISSDIGDIAKEAVSIGKGKLGL